MEKMEEKKPDQLRVLEWLSRTTMPAMICRKANSSPAKARKLANKTTMKWVNKARRSLKNALIMIGTMQKGRI